MKTIKQTVHFNASPHEVFELLMDSKKHAGFTGSKAKISRAKNGKIEAYGGWIEGKNLGIVKDKKIVQLWRGADWPIGHFSKVQFLLEKKGASTKLTFTQKNVPYKQYKHINQGWKDQYWEKMKIYLKNQ